MDVDPAGSPPHRALVVRFGRVGDLLVLTPVLRAMARAWPGVNIDLLTTPAGAATLGGHPALDETHVAHVRRLPPWSHPRGRRVLRALRARDHDVAFAFERNPRHWRWIRTLRGADRYVFLVEGRRAPPGLRGIPLDESRHFADCAADLLALAGPRVDDPRPDFPQADAGEDEARALWDRHDLRGTVVAVHPGAYHRRRRWRRGLRVRQHPKLWPPERYAEVLRELAARGADAFVLTGDASERAWDERVRALADGLRVVNLAGLTTLPGLGAVLRRCALLVAPDTGTAHVAAAVGTPLVALHSTAPPSSMGARGAPGRVAHLWPEPSPAGLAERRGYHPRLWATGAADVVAAVDRLGVLPGRDDPGTQSGESPSP